MDKRLARRQTRMEVRDRCCGSRAHTSAQTRLETLETAGSAMGREIMLSFFSLEVLLCASREFYYRESSSLRVPTVDK